MKLKWWGGGKVAIWRYITKTVSTNRGGTHKKIILVNRFPPFFSPQLNLWSCHRTHFFLFWHASRLFQKKDKSPEVRRSAKNASRPRPPDRRRWCKNIRCIHTLALILAMQPHGGKSCPCGCIARFLHLHFLPLKLVHQHKHDDG